MDKPINWPTTEKTVREGKKIELLRQVAEIEEQEEIERKAEEEARCEKLFGKIDALLQVVEHGRTSCSDENRSNYHRCDRCNLLEIKDQGYWPPECTVDISINWPRPR